MTNDIRIEKLQHDMIPFVKAFMLGVIKQEFGYDYNPEWHKDIDELDRTYLQNTKAAFYVAIEHEDSIVGTIAARPYDKAYEVFKNKYSHKNTLSIWRHYIKKELRGQGIGTLLLERIMEFSSHSGYKYIYLHTQKTIPGSLEYWLAKGFSITNDSNDDFQTVHLEKVIT